MSRYWSEIPSYSQPSVEELRRRAADSVSAAKKKGKVYEPVIPSAGRGAVCQSWWGQAWCENLERYADFGTRLERGRRYIRTGTVVDLKIQKGRIEARVQGSRRTPYKVEIRISPLSEEKCQSIISRCSSRIQNMEDLVYGKFPEEMKMLFTEKDGLFPSPAEISFRCSCPDWALMCKHVAAAMYGVGVRLDENPFYFFELRGIDVERFIDVALESKVESMLNNAAVHTSRMMDAADVGVVFGLSFEESVPEIRRPEVYLESGRGAQISEETIAARVAEVAEWADHIYVKTGENRAYWTGGGQAGSVVLWEDDRS